MELLGYREIVEKNGESLDDIFYARSFVRLWKWATTSGKVGYTVTGQQSGNGRDYFNQSFTTLDDAQKAYDTVDGILHSEVKA